MMKAIILAAGEGSRLRPLTSKMPKCLIPIEGRSLLDWQVGVLKKSGIDDITVVKGYLAEFITRKDLKYYENRQWSRTNMVETLWCAEQELDGEVIVSYGDIVYSYRVLKTLIETTKDIAVAVDLGWEDYWRERYENPLDDAESLIMTSDYNIMDIGNKPERVEEIQAQYMGLLKFSSKGIETLKESYNKAKNSYLKGTPIWGTGGRAFDKLYMTDLIQGLINQGESVYGVPVQRGWFEVDNQKDLEIAKKNFRQQIIDTLE